MIKIKDYIFNENEIREITSRYDITLELNFLEVRFISNKYQIIYATFEDIEWNYTGYEKVQLDYQSEIKELKKNNKTFEDYNKDLNNQLDKLEEENKKLKEVQCTFLGTGCKRRLQELEEENERLKAEVDLLNDDRHFLNNKIGKAIKLIKEDYFEDGSGNNIEEVIKTLENGEENE